MYDNNNIILQIFNQTFSQIRITNLTHLDNLLLLKSFLLKANPTKILNQPFSTHPPFHHTPQTSTSPCEINFPRTIANLIRAISSRGGAIVRRGISASIITEKAGARKRPSNGERNPGKPGGKGAARFSTQAFHEPPAARNHARSPPQPGLNKRHI